MRCDRCKVVDAIYALRRSQTMAEVFVRAVLVDWYRMRAGYISVFMFPVLVVRLLRIHAVFCCCRCWQFALARLRAFAAWLGV